MKVIKTNSTFKYLWCLIFVFFSSYLHSQNNNAIIVKRSGDTIVALVQQTNPVVKFQYRNAPELGTFSIAQSAVSIIIFQNGKIEKFEEEAYKSNLVRTDPSSNLISLGYRHPNYIISYERILTTGKLGLGANFISNFHAADKDFYRRNYYDIRLIDKGYNVFLNYYTFDGYYNNKAVSSYLRWTIGYEQTVSINDYYDPITYKNATEYLNSNRFRLVFSYGVLFKPTSSFFLNANAGMGLVRNYEDEPIDGYSFNDELYTPFVFELLAGYRF